MTVLLCGKFLLHEKGSNAGQVRSCQARHDGEQPSPVMTSQPSATSPEIVVFTSFEKS